MHSTTIRPRIPVTQFTVADFQLFSEQVGDLETMTMEQALTRTCELVMALPQNLIYWFRGKIFELDDLEPNTKNWVVHIMYERMIALGLV